MYSHFPLDQELTESLVNDYSQSADVLREESQLWTSVLFLSFLLPTYPFLPSLSPPIVLMLHHSVLNAFILALQNFSLYFKVTLSTFLNPSDC